MGIFVLNRLSPVSHLSDVGLTDFVAIPFFGSPVDVGDAGLAHQIEAILLLRFEHHHEGRAGIIAKASRSC